MSILGSQVELTFQDVLAILDIVRQASRFDSTEVVVDGMSVYVAARERSHPSAAGRSEEIARVTSILAAPALGVLDWDCDGTNSCARPGTVVSGQIAAGRIITLGQATDVVTSQQGVVVEVLAGHGTFVEYGQPLLRIEHI